MTHIAISLFFILLFIGVGIAAQMMVSAYWSEIMTALRGDLPTRRPHTAEKFTVTLRPRRSFAHVARRRAAF